jgi:hypothetical protein
MFRNHLMFFTSCYNGGFSVSFSVEIVRLHFLNRFRMLFGQVDLLLKFSLDYSPAIHSEML